MTKSIKILIISVLVIFVSAVIAAYFIYRLSDSTYVEIIQNGKVIYKLDLSKEKDRSFTIDCPDGGWNTVTIKDGKISVTDADCPDKTCVKTGTLRASGAPVVCLPHKLIIRYTDPDSVKE